MARQLREPRAQATAGIAGAALVAGSLLLSQLPHERGSGPELEPSSRSSVQPEKSALIINGSPLPPHEAARFQGREGDAVRARGVVVHSVPADEGFWLGPKEGNLIWVSLTGSGESEPRLKPGEKLSFTGEMATHGPGFARRLGVTKAEGALQLSHLRWHLEVPRDQVRRG